MKKGDVAAELEKLKGIHSKEVEAVKEVLTESKAPKKVAKKVETIQKTAHTKGEEEVKKTKGVKERGMEEPPKKKAKTEEKPKAKKSESDAPKGSDAMKEKMAKLRAMRKAKKDSEEA
jgi:hypothetical protein